MSTALGSEFRVLIGLCCSRRLVNQERNLAVFKGKVNKSIFLVDRVAAETLAQEYVPRGLPLLVHVGLDCLGDLPQRLAVIADLPKHRRARN